MRTITALLAVLSEGLAPAPPTEAVPAEFIFRDGAYPIGSEDGYSRTRLTRLTRARQHPSKL